MLQPRTRQFVSALALVALAAAYAPTTVAAATPPLRAALHTSREVFGFALASSLTDGTVGYPSWNFDLLSTVAFFGVHVDTAGQFVGDSGWSTWNSSGLSSMVSLAHQHGTRVVLTVVLQDFSANTPNMCAGLSHADTTVAQTVSEVKAKGVDGVNIDYEGLDGACGTSDPYWAQHAMTSFVQKMRSGLGSSNYLTVDAYASSAADGYGFFDVAGMAPYVDAFFVMAYDLEYSNYSHLPTSCSSFCLGPTAPLNGYYYNDSAVVSQYASVAGAGKTILGVPYYGRKACVGGVVPNAFPTSSVVADSYLDASTEATDPAVQAGSFSSHRDANSSGTERWDTWYNTTLHCTRELYWDDAVSLGKKYDLVNANLLRGVGIWNLNYGGGAPELWSALQSHFAKCTSATISGSPATPQGTGARITLTGSASGCASPQYRFWIQDPGRPWSMVQDYSSASTYTWTATGTAGTYHLEVDVRASPNVAYDAVASATYVLNPCTVATLTPDHPSPQTPGTVIALNANATCTGTPQYRFWIRPPGGTWTVVQDYGSSSSYGWNTSGKAAGSYGLEVDIRDQGSSASYEAVANLPYTLNPPCTSATLTPSPASPQSVSTTVTLTATSSGCPNPRYQFWELDPGSRWSMVQDYSSSSTYAWKTSGLAAGTYRLEVDVRDQSSTAAYDSVVDITDVLGTCSRATLSTDKPSPQAAGSSLVLTGIATCPGTPQYRFWVRTPGSRWSMVQDYSSTNTYTLNTSGTPVGYYGLEVDVRSQGSTAVYETVANLTYLIDSCSGATLTTSKASPQPRGTSVVLNGSATCAGTPQYRFWVRAPGGNWSVAQDYSASSTFTWNTTGLTAGTYSLEVDVRDSGSSQAYDTVANATFALT